MPRAKENKSAKIREAVQANPEKPASEIAKDIGVTAALVYNVKATMKKKAGGPKAKKLGHKAGKTTAAAKMSAAETSKAQRIRDVAKSLGKKVRPRDVIGELAKDGVTVSSAQVSTTLAAAGYRRRRRGKKAATTTAKAAPSIGLNLDALLAARAMIAKVGSVDVAQEALAAMKKLG